MQWFDTHAHLNDDKAFKNDRSEVIQRSQDAGVRYIVVIGTDAADSERAVTLANNYDGVYAAVGLQPNGLMDVDEGDFDRVVALAREPKVVAIGETGLDRHWDFTPFEIQREYFVRHLDLANTNDLPVIIHGREAETDIVELLTKYTHDFGPIRGIMHSYTGSAENAMHSIHLGLHVSFAGMVTFKKVRNYEKSQNKYLWIGF